MPAPSAADTFTKGEAFNRAMEIAQELTYTEVWHLIRELQALLAQKSYETARAQGNTNEK